MPDSFSRSMKYKDEQGNSPADEGGKQAGNRNIIIPCKYSAYFVKKQERDA